MRNRVEIMHGANLDQVGRRDPQHYGGISFHELERRAGAFATEMGLEPRFFHTNHEGEFIEHLHRLEGLADGVVVNAGAWTHYSWAIRDALEFSGLPAVEVHLSDVMKREAWRHVSVFDGLVVGVVSGKGPDGYRDALELLKGEMG